MHKFTAELDKFKKTLNLECNTHPVFDPLYDAEAELSLAESHKQEYVSENSRMNDELWTQHTKQLLDMKITNTFKDLKAQETHEEISLLMSVGSQFFQYLPTYSYM